MDTIEIIESIQEELRVALKTGDLLPVVEIQHQAILELLQHIRLLHSNEYPTEVTYETH